MWASLGVGIVSLKFRQFISAGCDAFGVILFLVGFAGVYVVLGGCWAWNNLLLALSCWIDWWGLVICLGAGFF